MASPAVCMVLMQGPNVYELNHKKDIEYFCVSFDSLYQHNLIITEKRQLSWKRLFPHSSLKWVSFPGSISLEVDSL